MNNPITASSNGIQLGIGSDFGYTKDNQPVKKNDRPTFNNLKKLGNKQPGKILIGNHRSSKRQAVSTSQPSFGSLNLHKGENNRSNALIGQHREKMQMKMKGIVFFKKFLNDDNNREYLKKNFNLNETEVDNFIQKRAELLTRLTMVRNTSNDETIHLFSKYSNKDLEKMCESAQQKPDISIDDLKFEYEKDPEETNYNMDAWDVKNCYARHSKEEKLNEEGFNADEIKNIKKHLKHMNPASVKEFSAHKRLKRLLTKKITKQAAMKKLNLEKIKEQIQFINNNLVDLEKFYYAICRNENNTNIEKIC